MYCIVFLCLTNEYWSTRWQHMVMKTKKKQKTKLELLKAMFCQRCLSSIPASKSELFSAKQAEILVN